LVSKRCPHSDAALDVGFLVAGVVAVDPVRRSLRNMRNFRAGSVRSFLELHDTHPPSHTLRVAAIVPLTQQLNSLPASRLSTPSTALS
jgi:hypothetical protein